MDNIVLVGMPGAGKSTVVARLMTMRDDVCFSVSATTRAPRPGEVDGVNYFFVTRERFDEMVRENALLEHAEYVGNFYGTPKEFVDTAMEAGRDVILEIDVQGALQVAAKRPEAILIFIAPPSWEELERRLTLRGTDSPEKIQKRLLRAGELIRSGVPVMKAAEQAGFSEYSTFLRAFQNTFHMSPREFR